jgi:4-hydroxybenzoate polyprenyltransferase/phosphoserine phosphatase
MTREQPNEILHGTAPSTRAALCVDLDGALVHTDTLLESVLSLLKRDPRVLFWCLAWLIKGRAHLKRKIAERSRLDVAELPYNLELLGFLEAERASGTRIVLATGADRAIANGVSAHLGLFDEVLASDGAVNMTGVRKAQALAARFGAGRFRYIGNSAADLPVWRSAGEAIVSNGGPGLLRRLKREGISPKLVFTAPRISAKLVAQALRLYQWPKNLLIFVPLLLSHRIAQPGLIGTAFTAMISFGLCASALYLVNDLLDLAADRAHPRKRARPFASGRLPLLFGLALVPVLLGGALLLGAVLGRDFLLILCLYAVLSTTYSFLLKEEPLLDVCVLAGLYVVRIFAGGAATSIHISSWTLGYSMFLFLSLALLKRYIELLMLTTKNEAAARGRGYLVMDQAILACFGAGTGCIAALLLALYIESDEVRLLYSHPQRLWLLCGVHIYWISRAWLLANRGQMHHDPVLFALRDRATYCLGLVAATVALLAK